MLPTPIRLFLVSVFALSTANLFAQDSEKSEPDPPAGAEKPSSLKSYRLQIADDPAEPLVPKKPRTAGEQNRLDAVSWYMTGQLLERRNEFNKALDAYKKAVELDPKSAQIHQSLVTLAFSLNQTDEAMKYALKAIELDPEDHRLIRRVAIQLANQRQVPQAIELLGKALKSPLLKDEKSAYVMLNRDLAILYAAIGDISNAAKSYEVVFDALKDPAKFGLNFRQRKSLESNPTTTFEAIGQVFLEANRPKLAVQAFEAALKARRGKPGTLSYNLASAYTETEQLDKALTEIQKYFDAQLQTKGRAAYELLAKILKGKKQNKELLDRLEKMAENDPHNGTLQFFLAEQYLESDRLDDAEELYKKTLEKAKSAEGYAGLASVYRRKNKPQELYDSLAQAVDAGSALELLEDEVRAIGKDEKLTKKLLSIARDKKDSDANSVSYEEARLVGRLGAEAKDVTTALQFYEFAMSRKRSKSEEIYEDIGQLFFDVDDYQKAADWFRKAVEDPAVPTKPQFLYRLSQAEELAGNTEAALEAVRNAISQIPTAAILHFQEGWIFYHAERYDDAIKKFKELAEKFPAEKDTIKRSQFILSSIYVKQGELRKGEEVLEAILAEDPKDPSVNNDLGYLYADHGKNLEKARAMIAIALKAEPENPAYLDSMGWVLYKLGEYKEAVGYLEKAVALPDGGDSTIWDHLADCYARLKQLDKAEDAWKNALKDAKSSPVPDEKLIERIEQKLAGVKNKTEIELP